ncbi:uncharacterized protein LOC107045553 [Diachasma alloeum]|uniref:uncharacterized protein LOC107045553 n=1 Tax=Diachasma alloeum TaxID=454923 RepID=UPI000738488B|nr:uncharacterized protein LOC107045553 [Diachasma alloeum]
MIDARLNFKQQVEHVTVKASGVRSALSRLMPNIGGPKQRKQALFSSVITSVLTYGIAIWAHELQVKEKRRKVAAVYRLTALRVASVYRTLSDDAVFFITGMMSIEVLAEERRSLYRKKKIALTEPN